MAIALRLFSREFLTKFITVITVPIPHLTTPLHSPSHQIFLWLLLVIYFFFSLFFFSAFAIENSVYVLLVSSVLVTMWYYLPHEKILCLFQFSGYNGVYQVYMQEQKLKEHLYHDFVFKFVSPGGRIFCDKMASHTHKFI